MEKKRMTRKETAEATILTICIIAFAILGQLIVGCSPRLLPPAEVRDSVRVEIRERVVRDTAKFYIEKEVEKVVTRDTSSHLENTYAKSDASVKDGFLTHSLESKPQYIKVPVYITVHDTTVVESHEQVFIEKPKEKSNFKLILSIMLSTMLVTIIGVAIINAKVR